MNDEVSECMSERQTRRNNESPEKTSSRDEEGTFRERMNSFWYLAMIQEGFNLEQLEAW